MINARIRTVLVGIMVAVISINCSHDPDYAEIVQACLDISKVTKFTVVGTDEAGISHNVPVDCIIGAHLPEFTAHTLEGKKVTLSDLQGKASILNFWFTSCAPCIAEMPALNDIRAKYSDQVNYLSFATDDEEKLGSFLRKHDFNFPVVANSDSLNKNVFHKLWGFPLNIITNSENVIVDVLEGSPTDTSARRVVFAKLDNSLAKALH